MTKKEKQINEIIGMLDEIYNNFNAMSKQLDDIDVAITSMNNDISQLFDKSSLTITGNKLA